MSDSDPTIEFLKTSLREVLDREEKRLTNRAKLLRRVYDAVSDGAALELSSTQTTDLFLIGSLNKYFPNESQADPVPLTSGVAASGSADNATTLASSTADPDVQGTPAGKAWCSQFPTGKTTAGLISPFRECVDAFIMAIVAAGGTVRISATNRPYERAWLMHYAWKVAHGMNPATVPAYPGINILWTTSGAIEMADTYSLIVEASLTGRHIPKPPSIQGAAIDMGVTFNTPATILDAKGTAIAIPLGNGNLCPALWAVGASYRVYKLQKDEPHWSVDGH